MQNFTTEKKCLFIPTRLIFRINKVSELTKGPSSVSTQAPQPIHPSSSPVRLFSSEGRRSRGSFPMQLYSRESIWAMSVQGSTADVHTTAVMD